ncbi:transposase [Methylorubrum extorquens]|uniref:Transposase n=1 Tax=Methylorubrum extorquens TaxID=408 RepID=A0AAX3WBQ3_METEX|nr:transposase [Methylorubrum extorquens]
MLDNLPAHKVSGVREHIEPVGARLLYLPPNSPNLNLIDLAFVKLEALLRSAAARTISDLWDTIQRSLTRFAPEEGLADRTAADYDATGSNAALSGCRSELEYSHGKHSRVLTSTILHIVTLS